MTTPVRTERVAFAAFLAESILAGGNAVAVRYSNRELEPLWGAGLRFSLAAAILLVIVAALRLPLPRGRVLVGAMLFGALNFAGAFSLAYYGLVRIHAGLGQTLLALVPLSTLLLAVLQRQERFRPASVVGTVLALAGVAVISGASTGESVPLLSVLAILGGTICFAQAAVQVRRMPPVHPVVMTAVGMATGAIRLVSAALVAGQSPDAPDREATRWALAYLVLVGSIVVFVLYLVALKYWSASRVAYGFVLTPIVTVLLSAWLDDEPLHLSLLLGGVLVLAGVYVGALRRARESEPAPNPSAGSSSP
jgi:drug/metabolite transporter (DMT)-like permease